MEAEWKFCTITINGNDYDCTVKNVNGSSQPKDIWYYEKWVSIGRFEKLGNDTYSIHSYRNEL